MASFEIIQPFNLYPVTENTYIISGTPLLYLKNIEAIVLGDIHLGIISSLFKTTGYKRSSSSLTNQRKTDNLVTSNLLLQLEKSISKFSVRRIILNGDIKHFSKSIVTQELEEISLFFNTIKSMVENVHVITGNHDELLQVVIDYLDFSNISVSQWLDIENYFIYHGHIDLKPDPGKTIIISHEHPSIIIRGYNRAYQKLPAFVTLQAKSNFVVILPMANTVSSGVSYPPSDRGAFLTPYLKKYANMSSIDILPFDEVLGLIELPITHKK